MAKYWIKLYHEILDDPKMGRLPDRLYRRVIELFLLAGEMDEGGILPTLADMAWKLRLDPNELAAELQEIERLTRIVHLNGNGWTVTKFAERQDADTGAERVNRYREAKRKDNQTVTNRYTPVTNDVTNAVQELELESELKLEGGGGSEPRPLIFELYESQIGTLTGMIAEDLKQAELDYPADWIEAAFREAARNNAHSWNYVSAILKRWKASGGIDVGSKPNGKYKGKQSLEDHNREVAAQVQKEIDNGTFSKY